MMTSLNRATEDALLERASTMLQRGDVALARVIYETLASYGSLRGTFKLAETYEARQPAAALKPDLPLARQWYERAALLGSVEAYQRLKALDQGG
jgi:TPR repeat protein